MNEELVEKFIKKLIEHISEKSSEAASRNSCEDSCWGMGSWQTEKELANSIREMFGVSVEDEEPAEEDDEEYKCGICLETYDNCICATKKGGFRR